jgi:hypothetical protein
MTVNRSLPLHHCRSELRIRHSLGRVRSYSLKFKTLQNKGFLVVVSACHGSYSVPHTNKPSTNVCQRAVPHPALRESTGGHPVGVGGKRDIVRYSPANRIPPFRLWNGGVTVHQRCSNVQLLEKRGPIDTNRRLSGEPATGRSSILTRPRGGSCATRRGKGT